MATLHESNVDFTVAAGWLAQRYDATTWYRKHFNACEDSAAMDFLVIDEQGTVLWMVEVKDFTQIAPDQQRPSLAKVVAKKARDTLAGILAGATRAGVDEERAFFARAARVPLIRVHFHCERPTHGSRLYRSLPDLADLKQTLRRLVRPIDPRVEVADVAHPALSAPWTTAWKPRASTP